jgi:hypothetical protein
MTAWRNLVATGLLGAPMALAAIPTAAQAQRPVAILVELDGKITPDLGAGAELNNKSSLTLAAGTTLAFIHYRTCRLVSVKGGTIAVDVLEYTVSGGEVLEEEKVTCPAEQAGLAGSGQASGTAALVLRSGAAPRTQIPLRPAVMAAGPRAAEFARVEFLDGERTVATLPLAKGRAAWPADKPALVAYRQYTARFVPASGAPVTFAVIANSTLKSDGKAPAIFRIE